MSLNECVKCIGNLESFPDWKLAIDWVKKSKEILENGYDKWLIDNPVPPADSSVFTGILGLDNYYKCSRGHKWRYGSDRGFHGQEVIFIEQDAQVALTDLLALAYDKRQAFNNFDKFGESGDSKQEWEYYYEEDYQSAIKDFLSKYIK